MEDQPTDKNMTAVVRDALRKQRKSLLHQDNTEARVQELMAIAERCASHIRQPVSAVEHGDMLYHTDIAIYTLE